MNRYDAADPTKFAAAAEVSITKDNLGKVYYGISVQIGGDSHGIVASVGSRHYSKDDLAGLLAMHWQALVDEGHIGHAPPPIGWRDKLITLTGDPLQDHLQVAYAAANQGH